MKKIYLVVALLNLSPLFGMNDDGFGMDDDGPDLVKNRIIQEINTAKRSLGRSRLTPELNNLIAAGDQLNAIRFNIMALPTEESQTLKNHLSVALKTLSEKFRKRTIEEPIRSADWLIEVLTDLENRTNNFATAQNKDAILSFEHVAMQVLKGILQGLDNVIHANEIAQIGQLRNNIKINLAIGENARYN